MSGATSSEKTSVALEVEVELGRMRHRSIDHCSGRAVAAPVSITFVLREEAGSKGCVVRVGSINRMQSDRPNVVSFSNDDDRDLGVNAEFFAGL